LYLYTEMLAGFVFCGPGKGKPSERHGRAVNRKDHQVGGSFASQGRSLPTIKDFNRRITYHGRRREYNAALEVKGMIEAAEALDTGIRRNVYTFNAWLDACVRCGRMEQAEEAMEEMISLGIKPNNVSFNTVLKGYATGFKTDLDKSFALLAEMKKFGVKPDLFSFNTVLNTCAVCRDMTRAKKLFGEMLKHGVGPDDFTITTLVKGWMAEKNVGELDKLLVLKLKMETDDWRSGQRKATAYNALADGYIRCNRPRKAIALIKTLLPEHRDDETDQDAFSILRNIEVEVDVNTFNVLLKAQRQYGIMSSSGLKVLEEMLNCGIEPDEITYLALMDLLCTNGDMDIAVDVIEKLKTSDVEITAAIYNTLVKGYARLNPPQLGKVFEIYEAMRSEKEHYCPPDHITSACVVDALARVGDFERATQVLNEAEESEHVRGRPRRETYNALIKAYRTALLIDLEALRAREEEPLEERAETIGLQLSHYLSRARRLIAKMQSQRDDRKHPDTVTYNTIIDMCAELGDVVKAQQLYEEMCSQGVYPDVRTFNALIKACNRARAGLLQAFKWTKEMSRKHVKPDQFTYAGLLSASAESKDVPRALEYFKKTLLAKKRELSQSRDGDEPIPQLAVHPSAYVSLMKAFSNLGVEGSAMIKKLREELEAQGYEMGASGYTAVANCYAQQGDYKCVEATFAEMMHKVKNIPESLNRQQQSIRMKAYCKGGNLTKAAEIFDQQAGADVTMYNILLSYCNRENDKHTLVRVLRRMEAEGIEPDAKTGISIKEMMRGLASTLKGFDQRFASRIATAAQGQLPTVQPVSFTDEDTDDSTPASH